MATISQLNKKGIRYKGGFRGSYIAIQLLIEYRIRIDVIDYSLDRSCVRNCESYCRMQIRISGSLYVTWHSSELLTEFLKDCKEHEESTGDAAYPLESCIVTVGDDRGYYLQDAPDDAITPDKELIDRLVEQSRRRR